METGIQYGVSFVVLGVFAAAVWRVVRWVGGWIGPRVDKLVAGHLTFLSKLAASNEVTAQTLVECRARLDRLDDQVEWLVDWHRDRPAGEGGARRAEGGSGIG